MLRRLFQCLGLLHQRQFAQLDYHRQGSQTQEKPHSLTVPLCAIMNNLQHPTDSAAKHMEDTENLTLDISHTGNDQSATATVAPILFRMTGSITDGEDVSRTPFFAHIAALRLRR